MSCDCDYALDKGSVTEQHYSTCSSVLAGRRRKRNLDGTLRLGNQHLEGLEVDFLYHLGLNTSTYDLPAMFGDVKFVCLGGTKHRMKELACYMTKLLGYNEDQAPVNLTKHSLRFAMYKVGPVLSVSHGIGIPSMTTALQEVIKLMYYAKAVDPFFFRVGTSGGIDIPAGSVVVSSFGMNGTFEKSYNLPILGTIHKFPSQLDTRLCQELASLASDAGEFQTFIGGTMGAEDFYRGQGRLDGPFCNYTEADKMAFLRKLSSLGIRNIEMEANAFGAITKEAGVRAAIVCVTLLNRLDGDQVTSTKDILKTWEKRSMFIVGNFVTAYMKKHGMTCKA
ncbi:hypothetical protein ACJJTC_004203 [Scirpophaga incertulas]